MGSISVHRSDLLKILDKCVKQTFEGMNSSVRRFEPYMPIGEAVKKLQEWHNQYTTSIYLSEFS